MCGIAGYIGPRVLGDQTIDACLDLMERRGPNSAGHIEISTSDANNVYLLHTRLSIIDLDERSNQPFRLASKVLTYNGELYNYRELRRDLIALGRSFQTESDTEVLLAAIDQFGWKALDKFEGMWAFAVYDTTTETLTLSRDRFGEKPLYTYRDETGFYFGSEIKFIFQLLGRRLEINEDHLYRYLVNGYRALYKTQTGFFKGIKELPCASIMTVKQNSQDQVERYWIPNLVQDATFRRADAIEELRHALFRTVELRLRADVPLAFCMSGGVDSNTLISIAKKIFHYDVHGFTIVNSDERYEEQELVDQMVKQLDLRHTSVSITSDNFLENVRTLIRQHDAPIYTISYYVHWLLMQQMARHGYKISVSGTGADELFTGYYDHHNFFLYEMRNSPKLNDALNSWNERIAPIVRNPYLKDPKVFFPDNQLRDHIYLDNFGFAEFLIADWFEDFKESEYTDSVLKNRMLNEMFHEAVPVILHEDDLNAMYYSIENRSPFLDRELFELSQRIPVEFLIYDGYAKVLLREAMQGIVPDEILWNPRKVGFNAPIMEMLPVHEAQIRDWILDESVIFNYIRRDKIEKLIQESTLPNSASKFLFYFVNTKIFLEEFAS